MPFQENSNSKNKLPEIFLSNIILASVENSRWHHNQPIAKLDITHSRSDVDRLLGSMIEVPESILTSNPCDGVLYWKDLYGRAVITSDGVPLGTIDHVYFAGASDIASIEGHFSLDIPLVGSIIDLRKVPSIGPLVLSVPLEVLEPLIYKSPTGEIAPLMLHSEIERKSSL